MLIAAIIILILVLAFSILFYTEASKIESSVSDQRQAEMDYEVISIVNRQNAGIAKYCINCEESIELRWTYNGH